MTHILSVNEYSCNQESKKTRHLKIAKENYADTETDANGRKKAIFRKENHNRKHCQSPCRVTEQTVPQSHRGFPVSLQRLSHGAEKPI